MQIYEIFFT